MLANWYGGYSVTLAIVIIAKGVRTKESGPVVHSAARSRKNIPAVKVSTGVSFEDLVMKLC